MAGLGEKSDFAPRLELAAECLSNGFAVSFFDLSKVADYFSHGEQALLYLADEVFADLKIFTKSETSCAQSSHVFALGQEL